MPQTPSGPFFALVCLARPWPGSCHLHGANSGRTARPSPPRCRSLSVDVVTYCFPIIAFQAATAFNCLSFINTARPWLTPELMIPCRSDFGRPAPSWAITTPAGEGELKKKKERVKKQKGDLKDDAASEEMTHASFICQRYAMLLLTPRREGSAPQSLQQQPSYLPSEWCL